MASGRHTLHKACDEEWFSTMLAFVGARIVRYGSIAHVVIQRVQCEGMGFGWLSRVEGMGCSGVLWGLSKQGYLTQP